MRLGLRATTGRCIQRKYFGRSLTGFALAEQPLTTRRTYVVTRAGLRCNVRACDANHGVTEVVSNLLFLLSYWMSRVLGVPLGAGAFFSAGIGRCGIPSEPFPSSRRGQFGERFLRHGPSGVPLDCFAELARAHHGRLI